MAKAIGMRRGIHLVGVILALGLAGHAGADEDPTPTELRALVGRVIANQHRDDQALQEYERVERRRIRKTAQDPDFAQDTTFRVVPTGTGVVRVAIGDRGRPMDAVAYQRQLSGLEQALAATLNSNRPEQKKAAEKFARRTRDRTEMLDAIPNAFLLTWQGREQRNGRLLAKLQLDPSPAFRSHLRTTEWLGYVRATVWVDEVAAQMIRVEAEVVRDISFGAGIVGKVYRGSRFVTEQQEVAPGLWLPTLYDYNLAGRKFLFGVEVHEQTEASQYRRVGSPAEALADIRRELARNAAVRSSP